MPFDYSHIKHNMELMAKMFLKDNPEQAEAVERSLKLSEKYLGCFLEDALVEGLKKKGFIVPDAATLQILLETYSKTFLGDKILEAFFEGKRPTTTDVIYLTLEDLGVPITPEMESEIQNLRNDVDFM